MPSAVLDLDGAFIIEQNADFMRTFQVNSDDGTPYDLTDAVLAAHIKRPLQRGTPNAEFAVTVFDPPSAGAGLLALTEAQTLALNTREPYKWDLLMRKEGVSMRLLMGDVVVTPAVTIFGQEETPEQSIWTADSTLITADSTTASADEI